MRNVLLFSLLFFVFNCFAQQGKPCHDIVYLRKGSVFKGKINEYKIDGDIQMTTWSGMEMNLPAGLIKRVVQRCKDVNTVTDQKPYLFKETGWYNVTRLYTLPGASGTGFGLQHSTGWKFNRTLGLGMGLGVENFAPFDDDITTYPAFAEIRGYFLPKKLTPFYALGTGWGFAGKTISSIEGDTEDWKGGWLLQGQLGYRLGYHFMAYIGIHLQHKTRYWNNNWGFYGPSNGYDKILQKRMEIGIGVML